MIHLAISEARFSVDIAPFDYSVFTVSLIDGDNGKTVVLQTFDESEGSHTTRDDCFEKAKTFALKAGDLLSMPVKVGADTIFTPDEG